jgi:hypothetical protein
MILLLQQWVSVKDIEFEITKLRSKYEYIKKEHPRQAKRIAMEMRAEEGPKFLQFALSDLPEMEWKKKKNDESYPSSFGFQQRL